MVSPQPCPHTHECKQLHNTASSSIARSCATAGAACTCLPCMHDPSYTHKFAKGENVRDARLRLQHAQVLHSRAPITQQGQGTHTTITLRQHGSYQWCGEPWGAYTEPWGAYSEPRGAYTEPWGAYTEPWGAYSAPWGAYSEPRGAYSEPWGAYSEPWGAYSEPRGAYSEPRGV